MPLSLIHYNLDARGYKVLVTNDLIEAKNFVKDYKKYYPLCKGIISVDEDGGIVSPKNIQMKLPSGREMQKQRKRRRNSLYSAQQKIVLTNGIYTQFFTQCKLKTCSRTRLSITLFCLDERLFSRIPGWPAEIILHVFSN